VVVVVVAGGTVVAAMVVGTTVVVVSAIVAVGTVDGISVVGGDNDVELSGVIVQDSELVRASVPPEQATTTIPATRATATPLVLLSTTNLRS
jgi:hypothetical protein